MKNNNLALRICHRCGLALREGDYSTGFEGRWCTSGDGSWCQERQTVRRVEAAREAER